MDAEGKGRRLGGKAAGGLGAAGPGQAPQGGVDGSSTSSHHQVSKQGDSKSRVREGRRTQLSCVVPAAHSRIRSPHTHTHLHFGSRTTTQAHTSRPISRRLLPTTPRPLCPAAS
ncbi:hypothetical protein HYQ46_006122 [Verticillium longisporum]|nr:hypothetical protein HYQ46_006122 [Verticillium longisporum]